MAVSRCLFVLVGLALYTTAVVANDAQPVLKFTGEEAVENHGRQLQEATLIEDTPVRRLLSELVETVTAPLARIESGSAGRKLLASPSPTPTSSASPSPTPTAAPKSADWVCFCGSGGRRLIEIATGVAKLFAPRDSVPAAIPAPHN